MPTPAELRERSRQLRKAATKETSPEAKRAMARDALAAAEQAEKIERENVRKPARLKKARRSAPSAPA